MQVTDPETTRGHEYARLAKKLQLQEIDARLTNWGRWLRYDNTVARLGYPTQSPFVFSPRKGPLIADLDAEHIEWIVSSLYVSGIGRGELYAFILRVEYAERPTDLVPHYSQRAADVSRRFKRPCAKSAYYNHLAKAREAVLAFAEPLK